MDFSKIHVLILEGYARQALPMIKAFYKLGCTVTTLNASKLDVGYASRYPHYKKIGICSRNDYKGTVRQVRELLQTNKYDLVVPLVDFSADLLARNYEEFRKYAKLATNPFDIYDLAQDKLKTMQICMENNIPCPQTLTGIRDVESLKDIDIKYPIIIKPRVGYGAVGFKVIKSYHDLQSVVANKKIDLSDYVIQEYIPQTDVQFEAAMFVDSKNDIKSALVFSKNRWFPVEGGSSTLNITIDRPDIVETCSRLLKTIGWRGCADVDLIQDPRDGIAKVMEINPRVSGSVKICFEAGIDLARQIIEYEFGEEVTKYKEYKLGQRLRCSQTDLLWFLKSPNRFKSEPSWFSFKQTKDHIFSLEDPLPWLSFSIQAVMRYKAEMRKRKE
ncbi:MAG TPA: ATP-grasp domain-containing protein [Gallicola sp.]|nr:ATP-grasp domain-containing protein [Gallicola sp.]